MILDDYEINIFTEIETYKDLIKEQEEEIAKREKIKESLTDSLAKQIRKIELPYSDKMLHNAFFQQSKENKSDRSMYEFIKEDLFKRLFSNVRKGVKLEKIMQCGYDSYAYSFIFKYEDIIFELSIPNTSAATTKNLRYMWYGKYRLNYEKKPNVWDYIADSYNLDDIAKAIEEFIAD